MVTLRAYSNPAQAAVAKSVLDDHKIYCALADENVNLYGGGPLAMPIRLMVADEQVEAADHILSNLRQDLPDVFDPTTQILSDNGMNQLNEKPSIQGHQVSEQPPKKNNPWEILVIASLFFLPGLCLLLQRHPLLLIEPRRYRPSVTVLSVALTHFLGWLAVAVALLFMVLFFYTRRMIKHEQSADMHFPAA
jgi:hypothetical protein